MTACGQSNANKAAPYVKSPDWSSVCLGTIVVDLPKQIEVADSGMDHQSGYGFDEKFRGAATGNQSVGNIGYQETAPATLKDLQSIKGSAKFKLIDRRIIHWPDKSDPELQKFKKHTGEVPLKDPQAYAFRMYGAFDLGYLDPADQRIRLFDGGVPGDKPKEVYTVTEHQAFYQHLRTKFYRARAPEELPTEPGVCTPFGLFRQLEGQPIPRFNVEVPLRSLKHPSLVFFVRVQTPHEGAPKNIKDLPDPNSVTLDDLKSLKGMEGILLLANLAGIKQAVGPEPVAIAGQPGRLLAREYHHDGGLAHNGGGPGAAYEMQADVVGVQGRPDMPAMTIRMAAMLPDKEPYPPPTKQWNSTKQRFEMVPFKPARPGIRGIQPPPFEEGLAYFRQVLASVRPADAVLAGVAAQAAADTTAKPPQP
ncbi:hypothetical protein [Aquabacterium parvum]|jgi:hypothetical protein|uniref:hypothetical protein n=1 Tax=Aquabacterium parvum TaxID=70584 RepID=UPI00128F361E|nr:hypothetical protein [Aquabacterium parvum]